MDLNDALMGFGLTRQESIIYLVMLSEGSLTGYEAAKRTGISRSNTYTALACLVDKGAAHVIEGTPVKYSAVDIEEFCDNKLHRLRRMKAYLKAEVPKNREAMEGYMTIRSDEHISDKIRTMLEQAQYRIYLSAESDIIEEYRSILERRVSQGLKLVILTDPPFELEQATIHLSKRNPGQIGLIVDSATVLTGDVGAGDQSTCLYSGKNNLVNLFKESLRNEIKLIELLEGDVSKDEKDTICDESAIRRDR